jgi:hypothetical protein
VNVLQPEFPFHQNPKARGRQTTWLYLGSTLEVLTYVMTLEQRGDSSQCTKLRVQTKAVILTPQLLRSTKYSLSLLNRGHAEGRGIDSLWCHWNFSLK